MAGEGVTYVFSHNPPDAKAVATVIRPFDAVNSAAFQVILGADATSNTLWSVRSLASGNPLAVQLTGPDGAALYQHSVHVANVVPMVGSVWLANSTASTITGSVSVTGSVGATVTGTVTALQGNPPWSWVGSSTVTGSVGAVVTGSVTATQGGPPWTWVGCSWLTNTPSVVVANSIAASVTQATSPWVVFPGSTGAFQGFGVSSVIGNVAVTASVTGLVTVYVASQVPGGSTITGSVHVTQASSPWVTTIASGGQFLGYVVASVIGDGSQVSVVNTPSVNVLQVTSPWITGASSLAFTVPQGAMVGSVGATQLGSPWGVVGSVSVTGSVGATIQGSISGTVVASVIGNPTVVASVVGQVTATASIAGNIPVTQVTSPWAVFPGSTGTFRGFGVSSVVGQVTVTASVAGNIPVTQVTSPWVTFPGSTGAFQGFHVTSVVGTVTVVGAVTQGTSPWIVTGSVGVTQQGSPWFSQLTSGGQFIGLTQASVSGQLTVSASVTGQLFATASVTGQVTVTASVIGQPTVTASISGNVPVTQVTSPWVVFPGSTGAFAGFVVASVIGNPTVIASVSGQLTATASVTGQLFVTASVAGAIAVTQAVPGFQLAKIAWEVSSFLPFPWDGSGICRSSGLGTINLAVDVLSSDLSGLAVMIVTSAATIGQVRGISGWANQSSREANITPNWTAGPSSGNQYVLGIDCRSAQAVEVKTEISSSTARAYYAIGLWTTVQSGNTGLTTNPQNVPAPVFDGLSAIDPIPTSYGVRVSSYWPAENKGVTARGYQLAKVYVTSATARFSLWGTAG